MFILLLLLLATSFGLKRPSSGQYLQKKNAAAYSTKVFILWDPVYNYFQPLDVLSVANCVVILYCEYRGCISTFFVD